MDVRIGITQTPKELEVEMGDDADRDKVVAEIEKLLKTGDGVLWLTDRKGRRVGRAGREGGLRRGRRAHGASAASGSAPLASVTTAAPGR